MKEKESDVGLDLSSLRDRHPNAVMATMLTILFASKTDGIVEPGVVCHS